jgi:hypothetical protein
MQRLCIFHLLSLIVVSGKDEHIWDNAYIRINMKLTDENKVSIVAALSLFCLVVVLKDVLHVKLDDIVYIIILCSCCYWLFGFFAHAEGEKVKESGWRKPLYWRILIIIVITLATMALYAI